MGDLQFFEFVGACLQRENITVAHQGLTYVDPLFENLRPQGRLQGAALDKAVGAAVVVCGRVLPTVTYVANDWQFPFLTLIRFQGLKERNRLIDSPQSCLSAWIPPAGPRPPKNSAEKLDVYDRIRVHFARTMDEAYYPGLDAEMLRKRNKDQTVWKEYRNAMPKRTRGNIRQEDFRAEERRRDDKCPILMVQNLWLFRFRNVLITAFPVFEGNKPVTKIFQLESVPDYPRDLLTPPKDLNLGLKHQMGLIISRQIDSFGQKHVDEQVQATFLAPLDIYERAVVANLTLAMSYASKDTKTSLKEDRKLEERIIRGIADIRDELVMIESVLQQQKEILENLMNHIQDEEVADTLAAQEDKSEVDGAPERLRHYLKRVQRISRDAERIQQTMSNLLEMKRANAAVDDTRSSIVIGVASLGFAFVTITFTPLAFLAGYFALPIEELRRNQYSPGDDTIATANTTFYTDADSSTLNGATTNFSSDEDTPFYRNRYIACTFKKVYSSLKHSQTPNPPLVLTELATFAITVAFIYGFMKLFGLSEYLADVFERTSSTRGETDAGSQSRPKGFLAKLKEDGLRKRLRSVRSPEYDVESDRS